MADAGRPWRIAALAPLPLEAYRGLLEGLDVEVRVPETRAAAEAAAVLADAEIAIGDWSGEVVLDAAALEASPHLAFVQQPAVGTDTIDVSACADRGIPVANTVGANSETRGLLDAAMLARLPDQAVLVNAARGGIVDEDAVADALEAGRLGGVACDVFADEPLPQSSRLRAAERVLLSPHVAGASVQARLGLLGKTRENVRRAVVGEPVTDVVNGADPRVRRRNG